MKQMQIGILNFAETERKGTHIESIQNLIDTARCADQSGFSRFWLGEHYLFSKPQTWTNPDMLLPVLASCTDRIKIGIAGSLVGMHRPFDIASNYKLLANLFPDRIDLGLAKGRGIESADEIAREKDSDPNEIFEAAVRKLAFYLKDEKKFFDQTGTTIPPVLGDIPDLWLLGTSYRNLNFSLEIGANFSRSLFHPNCNPEPCLEDLANFKIDFHRKFNKLPQISVALAGCCHSNETVAKRIIEDNIRAEVIQLDERTLIYGSPKRFYDQISLLSEKYAVDEFIILLQYKTQADRLLSLELLAKEFGF